MRLTAKFVKAGQIALNDSRHRVICRSVENLNGAEILRRGRKSLKTNELGSFRTSTIWQRACDSQDATCV